MKQKRSVSFLSGLKATRPAAFSAMVKPVGSSCNLRCAYCYYLDKEILHHKGVMSLGMLETFVEQYIRANKIPEITFCWHGGEPLLAGVEFYERALEFQRKYAGDKRIINTLQTNGTLLDERWAKFLAHNDFLIGISIDGPKDVHNATRGNSFEKAMQGVRYLQDSGVEFNTLSAVSKFSEGRGAEIYDFLKSIGSRYHQYLPVAEFLDGDGHIAFRGEMAPYSISGAAWGEFMIDVFDRWLKSDVGSVYVQLFDATLANYYGSPAGVCSLNENCGDGLVVEYTGDTYSCDHFVYPEHFLGNIDRQTLGSMYRSSRQFRFGVNKSVGRAQKCERCTWVGLCHGECPKHRDAEGLSVLCDGYQAFFAHTQPAFERMLALLGQGLPPAMVMNDKALQR